MKRITFLLMLLFLSLGGFGQFRATMMNAYSGGKRTYQVWSDGINYRYALQDVNGHPMVIIVRPEENKAFMTIPEKKVFRQVPCDDAMILMMDPVQGSLHFDDQKDVTEKIAGHAEVMGYDCVKKEYYLKYPEGDEVLGYVVYFSEKLNFPLKITFGTQEKVKMELRDLKPWKPEKGLFRVPEGYTEVDENMQPVKH